MAKPRTAPFIWTTWLASVMSGDNPCHWQAWFQTHNELTEKQPSNFDLAGWKIDHTRLLSELTKELSSGKEVLIRTEYPLSHSFGKYGTRLKGAADIVCWDKSLVKVFDCKTGKERSSDQIQVMLYMWQLAQSPDFSGHRIEGEVVYRSRRQSIPRLPDTFEDNLMYFIGILSGNEEAIKSPGKVCRFCSITKSDCTDRVD